jgi:hypothetical protein
MRYTVSWIEGLDVDSLSVQTSQEEHRTAAVSLPVWFLSPHCLVAVRKPKTKGFSLYGMESEMEISLPFLNRL